MKTFMIAGVRQDLSMLEISSVRRVSGLALAAVEEENNMILQTLIPSKDTKWPTYTHALIAWMAILGIKLSKKCTILILTSTKKN